MQPQYPEQYQQQPQPQAPYYQQPPYAYQPRRPLDVKLVMRILFLIGAIIILIGGILYGVGYHGIAGAKTATDIENNERGIGTGAIIAAVGLFLAMFAMFLEYLLSGRKIV